MKILFFFLILDEPLEILASFFPGKYTPGEVRPPTPCHVRILARLSTVLSSLFFIQLTPDKLSSTLDKKQYKVARRCHFQESDSLEERIKILEHEAAHYQMVILLY